MKNIGIKIGAIVMFLYIFPTQSMQKLRDYMAGALVRGPKPIPSVSIPQSTSGAKSFFSHPFLKRPSLESIADPYEKVKDQLSFLPISPMSLSKMAFTLMTGIPIFIIDLDSWTNSAKKLFSHIMGKQNKLTFTQIYQKKFLNLTLSNKNELLMRLEKLAQLSDSEKHLKHNDYKVEVAIGEKSQADAWLFGSTYRDAIRNAQNIDDLELLYEAATTWLCLRIESGLYDDVANLEIEFDRIDQQAEKIINQYDEQSVPLVQKYLQDMRQEFKNRFVQWLGGRQNVTITE